MSQKPAARKKRAVSPKSFRVALLIESSRNYGRGVLRGIAKYSHLHGQWSCFIEERELHGGIPAWLRTWKGHGIIARIEDRQMATELARLGHPVVDVLGNSRYEHIPTFDTDARAVAKLAADFFLQAGFQHFAFCGYRKIPFPNNANLPTPAILPNEVKKLLSSRHLCPRARARTFAPSSAMGLAWSNPLLNG